MLKIAELGRVQIFLSKPAFFGWNYYPRKYMDYIEDGQKKTLSGGIFKVLYFAWLEIRIFNKALRDKAIKEKLSK